VQFDHQFVRCRESLNSLNFSQTQVNYILGHSLASLYQDMLKQPMPDQLRGLLHQLERKLSDNPEQDEPRASEPSSNIPT
jgi:hypothetical protein